jgi:hypothetical protein
MGTTRLEHTCEWLAAFMGERAARGDVVARGFRQGLEGVTHAPPMLAMVRRWLANVAAERRLIRPDSDPAIATRILAELHAADARVPGSAERAWAALVAGRRAASS